MTQKRHDFKCAFFSSKTIPNPPDSGHTFAPTENTEMPIVYQQYDQFNSSDKALIKEPTSEIEIDASRSDTFVPFLAFLWRAPTGTWSYPRTPSNIL